MRITINRDHSTWLRINSYLKSIKKEILQLFDDYTVEGGELVSIQHRFERFHLLHPEVYDELVTLARLAFVRGRRHIGIGQIFEVLRWERSLRGLPDETEGFKLNNNYRSRYARLIMDREPDLDGVFEVRELKTR